MPTAVKRQIRVLRADYVEDADSILLIGECKEGRLRQQIHSSCFSFGNRDKKEEMIKTAKMMAGKNIWMVFDPGLIENISDGNNLE